MKNVKAGNSGRVKGKLDFMQRLVHDLFEIIGLFFNFVCVAAFLLAVVLHQKAVPLDFVKNTLEKSLSAQSDNLKIDIGDISLAWENVKEPLMIEASDVDVRKGNDAPFLSIKRTRIKLHMLNLLIGQVSLQSVELERPSLRLIHLGNKNFVVSFGEEAYEIPFEQADVVSEEADESLPQNGSVLMDLLEGLANDPMSLPASYRRLQFLRMENAVLQVTDFQTGRTLYLDPATIRLRRSSKNMRGEIHAKLPADYGEEARLDFVARYSGQKRMSSLQLSIQKTRLIGAVKDWVDTDLISEDLLSSNNRMDVILEAHFAGMDDLQDLAFSIQSDAFSYGTVENRPFNIDGYLKDLGAQKKFGINKFNFDGVEASMDGSVVKSLDGELAKMDLHFDVAQLPVELFDKYWPKPEPNPEDGQLPLAYQWMVQKMDHGTLKDIDATLILEGRNKDGQSSPPKNLWDYAWEYMPDELQGSYAFDDMTVHYSDTLASAEHAYGRAELDGKQMTMVIDKAEVNQMKVLPEGTLFFSDLVTKGKGEVKIDLHLTGSVKNLFGYLEAEPILVKQRIDLPFEEAQGDVDLKVDVLMPTVADLRTEDVHVKTKGTLSNLIMPEMVKGLTLSGGPYTIETTIEDFHLSGQGLLGQTPIDMKWHNYVVEAPNQPYEGKIEVKTTATPELRKAFDINVDEFVPTIVPLDIVYVERLDGLTEIDVSSDLTEDPLMIDMFQYKKAEGIAAQLDLKVILDKAGEIQDIPAFVLKGTDLDVVGNNLQLAGETFVPRIGNIEKFKIGENEAVITLREEEKSKNAPVLMDVVAGTLNAAGFLEQPKSEDKGVLPAMVIRVKADTLLMKNNAQIKNAELLFKQDDKGSIQHVSIAGTVGNAPLKVMFRPDEPEQEERLIFQAGNAGAALRALGLFETMQGGRINLIARPVVGGLPQEVHGLLYIGGFKVAGTPFLAQLLNSLSVEGIFKLFQEKGLNFDEFKAHIRTKKNDAGDWTVIFTEAKTQGGTLGIAFDGTTNIDKKTLNVEGHIIPVSGLNKVIGKIPLIGDLLSGGSGDAIFAANFSIKGPDKNPKVSVNPLSVLTPGILRKFLFESNDNAAPAAIPAPVKPEASVPDATHTEPAEDGRTRIYME